MKKTLRFFLRFVLLFVVVLLAVLFSFYLMAPVYQFSGPVPFHGNKLYNPYSQMNVNHWKLYNFQVQSKAWGGLTNGRKNSNELIDSVYHALGFDYVATSDYQKINMHGKEKANYIPTYEHGYNIFRTHQVCIGADEVLWTDFILFQTLSMKQWVIDLLDKHSEIVVLAHPLLNNGYTLDNLKYLTNYEMMEVLGNLFLSITHWDVALSSGQLAWVMGNDDAHDVMEPTEVARKFTLVNSKSTQADEIIANLKSGNNFAVDYFSSTKTTLAEKVAMLKKLPYLKSAELQGDTFTVSVSKMAREIRFIGENGLVKKTIPNTKSASYVIQADDPYIRTEISFAYDYTFFLNPVVRYEGKHPKSQKTATIDASATLRLRIIYFLVILSLVFLYTKRKQKRAAK
jgi:hypothetical protein